MSGGSAARKRIAVCGVSNRAITMFLKPLSGKFAKQAEVVALLDIDNRRIAIGKEKVAGLADVPTYAADEFERLITETRPDTVIVTGRDDTHVDYVVAALAHDLDVIVEKPMATTAADSRRIIEAEARSKGTVKVTFNYRYSPVHTRIKELIAEGRLGRITSVDLNWYIDTYHGSSYFQRWNRKREQSGGLSIHKSSHHFDLVRWWIDQQPLEVFAYGALNYYGPDSEWNPAKEDGRFCGTCADNDRCAYFRRWHSRTLGTSGAQDDHLGKIDVPIGKEYTGYRRDACMFDSEIEIEDTYSVNIKYDRGALLNYSVNFSLPYEGYRLAINGTKGRLETTEYHKPERVPFPTPVQTLDYFSLFGSKETIHVVHKEGGHGGGDPLLLEDLFLGEDPSRPYRILSDSFDGASAVATGEAVWRSVQANRPIRLSSLLVGEGEETP